MRSLFPRPAEPWALFPHLEEFFQPILEPVFGVRALPAVDIEERGDAYVVTADVPGFDKKDIQIELQNNTLIIRGERQEEKSQRFLRRERVASFARFERRFTLPEEIDHSRVSASFKDGELVITLPKARPVERSRQIPID